MIDYDAAGQAERQAWLKVRGKHLGTRLHDAVLWREWVAAAERMQQLSSQLKSLAYPCTRTTGGCEGAEAP